MSVGGGTVAVGATVGDGDGAAVGAGEGEAVGLIEGDVAIDGEGVGGTGTPSRFATSFRIFVISAVVSQDG